MKSSIKDVAIKSGFSVTTVSRALNGYSDVNAETRAKIQEVAKELRYVPNTIARSLVMKKTKTIALLVTNTHNRNRKDNFTYEVLCGVLEQSASQGYECIVVSIDADANRKKSFNRICQERMVDGVIIQGIDCNDPIIDQSRNSSIPTVFVDVPVTSENIGYVSSDQVLSIVEVLNFLVSKGHKNIAFVNGSEEALVSQIRQMGFRKGLQLNHISYNDNNIIRGDFKEEIAYENTKIFLKHSIEVTAFICASDVMAIGVMQAIHDNGQVVGKDISVVGFDNIPLAEYLTPSLTTVSQDTYQMGKEAVKLLIDIANDCHTPKYTILKNVLVNRNSTN